MHRRALFLLAWMLPYWLIVEATPTKLPHYILPIYPAVAIGAAWVLREVTLPGTISRRSYKQAAVIWALVAFLQAAFLAFLHIKFRDPPSPWLFVLAAGFAIAATMTVRAAWRERFHAAIVTGVLSAIFLYTAVYRLTLPTVEALWPSDQLAHIQQLLRPCSSTPFVLTRYREPSAIFLLGTDTRTAEEGDALEALQKGQADFAVFAADAFNRIARRGGEMPQVLACINAYQTTRGRKLRLHVLTFKAPEALAACPLPATYHCER
jgi:4-amino-4-deoxy-L-arabinose transferase-like glycosyltransferase